MASLQSPSHDTEPTPRAIKARETHHAPLVQLWLGLVVLPTRAAVPTESVTSSTSPSGSAGLSMSTSSRSQTSSMRVSRALLSVWSCRFSFHDAICVQPCLGKPFGIHNRMANKLPVLSSGMVSLDPRFFIQHQLVTSLKQTAGGNQRFAHICDLAGGVHVASSACLDSKKAAAHCA